MLEVQSAAGLVYRSAGLMARLHPGDAEQLESACGPSDRWLGEFRSRVLGMSEGSGAYTRLELDALADRRLLVVGGGAVGGRTLGKLVMLGAATGDGLIRVFDPDVGEVSNLQRQILPAADAGRPGEAGRTPKVASLVRWVDAKVPFAQVEGIADGVRPEQVEELIGDVDAVVMAADVSQPAVNFSILETCVRRRIPVFGGLDLNRTAISWHWTPENERSPLLRGLHRYGPSSRDVSRLSANDITTTDIEAVMRGEKIHALGWIVQMLDPADLPASILQSLVEYVGALQKPGREAFLPQAGVAATRQAQQTADTIARYFSPERRGWSDAHSYVVFEGETHGLHAGLRRAERWDDAALAKEVRAELQGHAGRRADWIRSTFGNPDPVARLTLALLGVSVDELLQGRSPLVTERGQ
ncbi:MAG: ThiF family adenylyltransferase [Myxococcota bacterium]